MKDLRTAARFHRHTSVAFRRHFLFLLVSALLVPGSSTFFRPPSVAAAPNPAYKSKAFAAFSTYVQLTDARNTSELEQGKDFLYVDALPEPARAQAYRSLAQGQIQIQRRTTTDSGREISCPDGMIHHWEGLVFIPGVRLDDVLKVLQDYDHHSIYYAPDVVRSNIESRDGDHFRVFLRFRRQKVITVVLNTEHDVRYFRDSPSAAHSRSSATHIAEVENPGRPNESEKPREDDNGFLWGMATWWRAVEKDDGVYLESEVVSLTRDIPAGLGWMIGAFITSIPKDALTFTLEATRNAVLAQKEAARRPPRSPTPRNGAY
jgi:hypothetical protein